MNTNSTDKYLLLFRSAAWYENLSEEKVQEIIADWMEWFGRLTQEGTVEGGNPLGPEGKTVSGEDGRMVSDGPFAEAKETVGGYFIVRAKNIDEAVAVARQCPGLPYGIHVEVRPMLKTCPFGNEADAHLATASA